MGEGTFVRFTQEYTRESFKENNDVLLMGTKVVEFKPRDVVLSPMESAELLGELVVLEDVLESVVVIVLVVVAVLSEIEGDVEEAITVEDKADVELEDVVELE